jgi:uncharacterized iron-regulated membrane protein
MFATWGHLVHRFRWLILLISVLMVPVSVLLISAGGSLTTAWITRRPSRSAPSICWIASYPPPAQSSP